MAVKEFKIDENQEMSLRRPGNLRKPHSGERPVQAVILAGGRGTRLAPLTNNTPKPMIEFHGKPFLEYLLEMVKAQGFSKVLLLLGYLPDVIRNYFGNGEAWGIAIEYAVSNVDDDTGRRLKLAANRLDPLFLLMYCDNYWPMNFGAMWQHFSNSGLPAQITVYRNDDSYTRSNLRLDTAGHVAVYDKSRSSLALAGVDIGYVLLHRSVIESLPSGNVSFESEAYPQLIGRNKLGAHLTDHRYYSVGSIERLAITRDFLARRPSVLLDRDGVLNRRMPRAKYVCSWADWHWLPGSLSALRLFKNAGYRVIILTNQPGVARKNLTTLDLDTIHDKMKADVYDAGGEIEAIYYCPHNWDDGCSCRKPRPGLLIRAQRDFNLDLSRTCFIGDDERDAQAAEAAGAPWELVSDKRPLLDLASNIVAQSDFFNAAKRLSIAELAA